MAHNAHNTPRVAWLDGLRGIAAVQVVLFHYASAFLPGIGLLNQQLVHYRWEHIFINTALFLPFDGFLAVCIFFVLSGVALTWSFEARPFAITTNVLRRLIRLGLPMIGAVLIGATLYTLMPHTHIEAARHTNSATWLGRNVPDPISLSSIVHQIGLEGLLAGYQQTSVLPWAVRLCLGLVAQTEAYDAPLWTLHIKFIGSLMVMLLVGLRRAIGGRWHFVVCGLLTVALAASFFVLFVVGHMAAGWLRGPAGRRSHPALGITLVGLGIICCTTYLPWTLGPLVAILPAPFMGLRVDPWVQQQIIGAVAIFVGMALLPGVQTGLAHRGPVWLGTISFSLYLTHFPLLFTLVSAGFIVLAESVSYGVGVLGATLGGLACSVAAATLFERWVDLPAIALSRRIRGVPE